MATVSLCDQKVLVVKFVRDVYVVFGSAYDLGTSHEVENGADEYGIESLFLQGVVVYFPPGCDGKLLLAWKLVQLSNLLKPFGVIEFPVILVLVVNIISYVFLTILASSEEHNLVGAPANQGLIVEVDGFAEASAHHVLDKNFSMMTCTTL